jgi:hypothetical protein
MIEQMRIDEVTGDLQEAMEALKKLYNAASEAPVDVGARKELRHHFGRCMQGLPVGLLLAAKQAMRD